MQQVTPGVTRGSSRRLAGLRSAGAALAAEAMQLTPRRLWERARAVKRRRWVVLGAVLASFVALFIIGNLPFGSDHGWILPRKAPLGFLVLGVVYGAVNSLAAIGLVLIYRAGRYINFAQGGAGGAGVMLTAKIIQVGAVTSAVGYLASAVAGLAMAAVVAIIAEILLFQVGGLFRAPRLIITVATLGIVQIFAVVEYLVGTFRSEDYLHPIEPPVSPIHVSFDIGIVPFNGSYATAALVVPVVIVALSMFLRLTDFGVAIQAAAQNGDRARLLGVSVRRMHTLVWGIGGLLSGFTALLAAPMFSGFNTGAAAGPALFLLALAPAILGGMRSLPVTFFWALGLGVIEQLVSWNADGSAVNVALLAVLLIGLLVRRQVTTRGTEGEERSFATASRIRPIPRELSRLRTIRGSRVAFRIAMLAAAALIPLGFDLEGQLIAESILVFVMAGVSLVLLTGFSGQVSFGQWAIVGFGALFGGWLGASAGVDFWLGMLIVALAGGLLATVIGIPALRIRGLFLGAVTLAFALACADYFFGNTHFPFLSTADDVHRPSIAGFDLGAHPDQAGNEMRFYWFILLMLGLVMWIVHNIRSSRWGRNMLAVRDNEKAAAAYGVRTVRTKLFAFAASGMIAALAGYLLVYSEGSVSSSFFPVSTSLLLFSAVVIGGLGSISGAVIGALYFEGVQHYIHVPQIQLLASSLGLLLVLVFIPGGVGSLFFGARDAALRLLARRWGIHVPSLVADSRIDKRETDLPSARRTEPSLVVATGSAE